MNMKPFDVYPLFDIEISRAHGCYVYDRTGTEYLDLYGGHAVISVGHTHPHYVESVCNQARQLSFYSNSVINPLQQRLSERLGKLSGYEDYALFLVNSGAEANENALKLTSFHTGKKRVIAFNRSFHGRTSAAVKVTDNPRIIAPVNDNMDVTFIALNDLCSVEQVLKSGDVCAVIIEGIQGVGGIQVPSVEFLQGLRRLTEQYGTILIADEVQSGYGRTGLFFAHQYADIRPDLITVAKGMGNGFPIGGVLISPLFTPVHGMLGTTFGGNHLACTAAIAVLDIIEDEHLIDNAADTGEYLAEQLSALHGITEVRGKGLMIGFQTGYPVKDLRKRLLTEKHIFTGASGTDVIRLLPPLSLSRKEADIFIERLKELL